MRTLLQQRYTAVRPGTSADRYVRAAQVPTAAQPVTGVDRVADYLVLDTYGAGELHDFEVKVSRGDLLAELRAPQKAAARRRYCDRWWLVVPDRAVVVDDLPPGCGLTVVQRGTDHAAVLRVARTAERSVRQATPGPVLAQCARRIAVTARREAGRAGATGGPWPASTSRCATA